MTHPFVEQVVLLDLGQFNINGAVLLSQAIAGEGGDKIDGQADLTYLTPWYCFLLRGVLAMRARENSLCHLLKGRGTDKGL